MGMSYLNPKLFKKISYVGSFKHFSVQLILHLFCILNKSIANRSAVCGCFSNHTNLIHIFFVMSQNTFSLRDHPFKSFLICVFDLTETDSGQNIAVSGMRKGGGRRGGKKQSEEVAIVTCPGCVVIISLLINLNSNSCEPCSGFPGYCSESYVGNTCTVVCARGRNNVL